MSCHCCVSSDTGFYVWGSNAFGQLGTGNIGGQLTTPALFQVLKDNILYYYRLIGPNCNTAWPNVTLLSCIAKTYIKHI